MVCMSNFPYSEFMKLERNSTAFSVIISRCGWFGLFIPWVIAAIIFAGRQSGRL